eukprot:TRINITY_DN9196_c0_g4_i1.p1 TRINITY_DN9196_c0_g4~~TRINITY_DN9196_c0_g4_i1.p1  ORF type:complete len:217 (+),score=22.55 TRINITY_DN9196_c0_g4_i1:75-725(+)
MHIKCALVARGTFVICEYDASTGSDDLCQVSRKALARIPRTGAIRSYVYGGHTFNYLLDKDLIFLCVASVAVGSELALQFLQEFRREYEKFVRLPGGADKTAELTRSLRELIGSYNSQRNTTKVRQMEQELEDVTDMMRDNLSKVMERGERIESLIDKTAMLRTESVSFRAGAKRHSDAMWWREQRGNIIMGLCLMMIVGLTCWRFFGPTAATQKL